MKIIEGTLWWKPDPEQPGNYQRSLSIRSYYKYWSKNGVGMQWGTRTNGAQKDNPADTCYDLSIYLGYIVINYTNWYYG